MTQSKDAPMRFRAIAKDLCPPFLARYLQRTAATFSGDYSDFDSASRASKGYTSANIIPAEVAAFQRADLQGTRLDERTIQLLAAFASIPGPLKVLDYGGASGYYYFHLSRYLNYALDWVVYETKPMVEAFRKLNLPGVRHTAEIDGLSDVTLFSGSLQYLPEPYEILAGVAARSRYLIFNRLPLIHRDRDRLMVQKTVMHYTSSYPVWFFSQAKFKEFVSRLGTITMEWTLTRDIAVLDGQHIPFSGLVVKLK